MATASTPRGTEFIGEAASGVSPSLSPSQRAAADARSEVGSRAGAVPSPSVMGAETAQSYAETARRGEGVSRGRQPFYTRRPPTVAGTEGATAVGPDDSASQIGAEEARVPPGQPPGPTPQARGSQGTFHLRGSLNRPGATTWESTAEGRTANVTDDDGNVLRISTQREKTEYNFDFKPLPKKEQAHTYNN